VGQTVVTVIDITPRFSVATGRSPLSEGGSRHAFFATGSADRSQLVAVTLATGDRQVVGPYIWRTPSSFPWSNLSPDPRNLLDEAHGLVYTVSGKTLAAYEFRTDQTAHAELHRLGDLRRAIDTRDRATALVGTDREAARSEALRAVDAFETFIQRNDVPAGELVVAQKGLADSKAVLAK